MKSVSALSLAVFTAACMSEPPREPSPEVRTRLAEQLGDRVAGPSVACVESRDLLGNRTIGEEVILFDGRGGTIYVNRPRAGCPSLDFGRALKIRTPSTRLCEGDIVTVFDPVSGFEHGGCGLGQFTPYRRVR